MSELLPCPFCGGPAKIIVVEKGVRSIVKCTGGEWCGFERLSWNNGDTDEHAAMRLTAAWNLRVRPDAIEQAESLISTMKNNKKAILWLKKYGKG